LDVSVNEAVVFEDALHGIRSAKEAGFYTVGVYDQDNENEKGQIMEIADDYVYRLSDWEEG
ncbi:MAG TPA: HAD family phosphatase, partial [Firmicutes bacterium]|nr:HAD family phosphatase [Bacillota bacterium]